jgi:hypothetical protein
MRSVPIKCRWNQCREFKGYTIMNSNKWSHGISARVPVTTRAGAQERTVASVFYMHARNRGSCAKFKRQLVQGPLQRSEDLSRLVAVWHV